MPGVRLKRQRGTDLGMRMFNAFEDTLKTSEWALLVGTDCPAMEMGDILKSIDDLGSGLVDAVIGPAMDGGYYLIGLRSNEASLFREMPCGSRQVYSLTCSNMAAMNWNIGILPVRRDIDRPEDLEYLPRLKQV